jgi:Domain of unknown function (DUF4303)
MTRIPCTKCGTAILETTANANGGLCAPCARGAGSCVVCGERVWERSPSGEYIHGNCARKIRSAIKISSNLDRLEQALYDHGIEALKRIREARPNDHFYSFAFYTSGEYSYAFLTASSYEGLEESVASYARMPHYATSDPEKIRRSLKWSPCDSPLHEFCDNTGDELDSLIGAACEEYMEIDDDTEAERFVDRLESTFVSALRRLDAEGYFGSPEERTGLVLNLLKGDQSDEERLRFASLLNPPKLVAAYAVELAVAHED